MASTTQENKGSNAMNRYESAEFKELISIQNKYFPNQDIITITGFMNHEEFIKHVERYKALATSK
jgi:hypothetical protein